MTWQMIVLIAIGAVLLLAIGSGILFWSLWNKTTKQVDAVFDDMSKAIGFDGIATGRKAESVEDTVARLTGPTNPFDALKRK